MMQENSFQTLKFSLLEYPAADIEAWLDTSGVDWFVFDFYFPKTTDPGRPIYLCCFVRAFQNNASVYLNAYGPDVLAPYYNNALLLNGPLRMAPNIITAAQLRALLPPGAPRKDYFLFTPSLDSNNQVYYTIRGFQRTDSGDIQVGDPTNTNPSPPAMF